MLCVAAYKKGTLQTGCRPGSCVEEKPKSHTIRC